MTGNKVYVIVTTDKPQGAGLGTGTKGKGKGSKPKLTESEKQAKEKQKEIKSTAKRLASYALSQAVNVIESAVSFNANNKGYLTGNYIAQRDAQIQAKLVNTGLNMGQAFVGASLIGGSLSAGVWGIALSLTTKAVSNTINFFQNQTMIDMSISKADKSAEFYAARSGLSSNTNNSRGTDN